MIKRNARDYLFMRQAECRIINKNGAEEYCGDLKKGHVAYDKIKTKANKEGIVRDNVIRYKIINIIYSRYGPNHIISFEEYDKMGRPEKLEVTAEICYFSINERSLRTEITENDCIELRRVSASKRHDWSTSEL